jgi:hypothetical protein
MWSTPLRISRTFGPLDDSYEAAVSIAADAPIIGTLRVPCREPAS